MTLEEIFRRIVKAASGRDLDVEAGIAWLELRVGPDAAWAAVCAAVAVVDGMPWEKARVRFPPCHGLVWSPDALR